MRLFFAYDFDKESLHKLILLQKMYLSSFKNIRLTKEMNLHLTIKFIGEFDDYQLIIDKIKSIDSINSSNINLTSSIITAFPSIFNARVIVCKFDENNKLNKIYSIIEENLKYLNIKKEDRDFVPHITLARTNFPIMMKEIFFNKENFLINRLKLYKSTLTKNGPIYDVIYEF
ncbi:MAG: RNA 2',3'-cyclic phosphodiesterase [Spirochaetes bacterium]|nr:RNA 2',3'-cyclic phosphodiesterase [Spirochaetota bacterium]